MTTPFNQKTDTAIAWTAVMGIHPSYGNETVKPRMLLFEDLLNAWNDAMEREFQKTKILVSCSVSPTITIYPQSLGCPKRGEQTVTLSGSSHPEFITSGMFDAYMTAVKTVVREVAEAMEQKSVRIDFTKTTQSIHLNLGGDE